LKLLPLAVLALLAPGRVRRFGANDWLLCGLACGMGFHAAEDSTRQVIPHQPGITSTR
jgi:RsiW-degrading membrane proteinase PrsW (M82 family)